MKEISAGVILDSKAMIKCTCGGFPECICEMVEKRRGKPSEPQFYRREALEAMEQYAKEKLFAYKELIDRTERLLANLPNSAWMSAGEGWRSKKKDLVNDIKQLINPSK